MHRTPANRQTSLKAEQRAWIAARNDCRSASDARGCIADAYAERIAELERR